MKKYLIPASVSLSIVTLLLPAVTLAQGNSLIPCDGVEVKCTFDTLMQLLNSIIDFLLYKVAVPLAGLGIGISGIRLIFNREKESAWSEAKEAFWSIGKGFLIILSAFVVVKTILFMVLSDQGGYKEFLEMFLGSAGL